MRASNFWIYRLYCNTRVVSLIMSNIQASGIRSSTSDIDSGCRTLDRELRREQETRTSLQLTANLAHRGFNGNGSSSLYTSQRTQEIEQRATTSTFPVRSTRTVAAIIIITDVVLRIYWIGGAPNEDAGAARRDRHDGLATS